jgi:DNA-binding ferritin-like protein
MNELAVSFRTLQFFAHNCHNLAKMVAFFADHDYLGDLYSKYESEYDSIVERMIGKNMPIDLVETQSQAADRLKMLPAVFKDNGEMFGTILSLEKELCQKIEQFLAKNKVSQGILQLLGEQVNQSEMRQYKLQQRIKK